VVWMWACPIPGASPDGHGEAAQSDDAETYDPAPHDAVHDGPVLDEEPRPIAAVCRARAVPVDLRPTVSCTPSERLTPIATS